MHNLKVHEQAVISSLIFDPYLIDECDLEKTDFYFDSLGNIFEQIKSISNKGATSDSMIDLVMLNDFCTEIYGKPHAQEISYCTDISPQAHNFALYCDKIKNAAKTRAVNTILIQAQSDALNGYDYSETIQKTTLAFDRLLENEKSGLLACSEIAQSEINHIEKISRGEITPGIPTGYHNIDRLLGGYHPGDLTIIAARPSMGKSGVTMCLAKRLAENGTPCAFYSLEMTKRALYHRILANETGINSRTFRAGPIHEGHIQEVKKANKKFENLPLYIDDKGGRTAADIASDMRRAVKQKNIKVAFVDYLQFIKIPGVDKNAEFGQVTKLFKDLAKSLKITIVLLAQLNRKVEERKDKRPMLSDLRDSGEIEQDADNVFFLYRGAVYEKEKDGADLEFIVSKQREGATGILKCRYALELQRFFDHKI